MSTWPCQIGFAKCVLFFFQLGSLDGNLHETVSQETGSLKVLVGEMELLTTIPKRINALELVGSYNVRFFND
jgi:hypothetical protein